MTGYRTIKLPVPLMDIVDDLISNGKYSSRAEYIKELIRNDLRRRGLLEDILIGTTHTKRLAGE